MSRSLIRVRVLFLICVVWAAVAFAVGLLRPLDRSLRIELPPWVRLPAILAIVFGGAIVVACGIMLSTKGIGSLSGDQWMMPREFIARGPFKLVRNPMSLGGVVLMVRIALWYRSTLALCLAMGLFLVFHLVVIRLEEPGLERRFGESYRAYKRQVPRWIPRIPRIWMPARSGNRR